MAMYIASFGWVQIWQLERTFDLPFCVSQRITLLSMDVETMPVPSMDHSASITSSAWPLQLIRLLACSRDLVAIYGSCLT